MSYEDILRQSVDSLPANLAAEYNATKVIPPREVVLYSGDEVSRGVLPLTEYRAWLVFETQPGDMTSGNGYGICVTEEESYGDAPFLLSNKDCIMNRFETLGDAIANA